MGINSSWWLSNIQKHENLSINYSKLEDRDLVVKARDGDKAAFSTLVRKYEQTVAGVVIGMLGRGEDAEDIGQNVFIRFYKALDDYRGDAALGTYLTRIAINLSLNELKRQQRRNLFFYKPAIGSPEIEIKDTQDRQDENNTKQAVHHALQQLDAKFRSVVVLRMLQGYSTKETAEILKLPLGTVLSRLARAQEKLKELLKHLIE
jgi:RNA polymerase sigma-70 factor (ECF subfamily)